MGTRKVDCSGDTKPIDPVKLLGAKDVRIAQKVLSERDATAKRIEQVRREIDDGGRPRASRFRL